MKNIKTILMIALGIGAFAACDYDDAQDVDLVELGAVDKEYVAEAVGDTLEIQVYSNGDFHIDPVGDAIPEWLTLSTLKGSGDQTVVAECQFNEEFKRKAGLVLCSDVDSRRDTIYIKQKGLIDASLSMENTSVIAPGKGGEATAAVSTNVPFEYMSKAIEYADEANVDWIKNINIAESADGSDNRTMEITVDANPDQNAPRVASITFSFTDGWGDNVSILVNLVQRSASESLGTKISMKDVRDQYSTGSEIQDYVIMEGYVVSNPAGGNSGENEQTTTSAIDYTGSKRTVYIESLDGQYGISVLCKTADDNIFNQWDKVQILLKGTTLTEKSDPDRYDLTGVTKSMVVSQIAGSKESIPVKKKHMNELTDDDIYTYVTLTDVEIPVRKGAIAPLNEGYTIATNAHRCSKYPRLIRDINGDAMYMYTNTVCTYRSDGSRLPYGSGSISGVVVHERFSRFEWRDGADPLDMEDDPTLGYIGRYQIRHQTKGDVWDDMNDSVEDSFSALLCEYRFWNPDVSAKVQRPSYGTNGWFDHTYQEKYSGSADKQYLQATYQQHMWGSGAYSYLGPMGNSASYMFGANFGNKNGIGVVIDPAKEHWNSGMNDLISTNPDGTIEWCGQYATNVYAGYGASGWSNNLSTTSKSINYSGSTSLRGKANVDGNCYTSFASHFWWDYDTNRPYGWLLNFSTEGISTNHISMQISVMNRQQTWYSPRFWKAEWSFTDSQAEADDSQWHLIKEYTVPDVSVWSNTLYSSIVGYKHIDFELPLEILGHENVYIRLVPTSDLCSDGADYANAHLKDNGKTGANESDIEYIAIRYNK